MSDPLDRLRLPVVPVEPRAAFAEELLRRMEGAPPRPRDTATVRYFVDDLDAAVAFYRDLLGFDLELWPSPMFAMLYRGELRLLLTVPAEPHALPGTGLPAPGGDNRISLRVEDLAGRVAALREAGAPVRTPVRSGIAVDTVLVQDPAGNLIELIEPRAGYHERTTPPSTEEDLQ